MTLSPFRRKRRADNFRRVYSAPEAPQVRGFLLCGAHKKVVFTTIQSSKEF
jgi:hypothetical protein